MSQRKHPACYRFPLTCLGLKNKQSWYLAVRLRFLQVTRLCCLIAADLVIQGRRGGGQAAGLGGGQQLYSSGNQTSLIPHGQQGITVLLPQAPRERGRCISVVLNLLFLFIHLNGIVLSSYWLFAMGWAEKNKPQFSFSIPIVLEDRIYFLYLAMLLLPVYKHHPFKNPDLNLCTQGSLWPHK